MLGRQVIWNPLLKASTQLWRNRKFFLLNSGKKNISELKEIILNGSSGMKILLSYEEVW